MSPRSRAQFEEMRQNSRKAILEAAFELFAKKGFHNTSVEQIRKKAGVSKGLVYNYFKKKEDLMERIIMLKIEEGEALMKEIFDMTDSRAKLKAMIDLSIKYLEEDLKEIQFLIGLSLQLHDFPKLEEIILARYSSMMPALMEIFKGMDHPYPDAEAHFLAAYFDGLGQQKIVLRDALDLEIIRQYLYRKYQLSE